MSLIGKTSRRPPACIFGRPSCRRRAFDTTGRRSRAPGALPPLTDATASLSRRRLPGTRPLRSDVSGICDTGSGGATVRPRSPPTAGTLFGIDRAVALPTGGTRLFLTAEPALALGGAHLDVVVGR